MLEQYEMQYAESATAHSELSKRSEHGRKVGPPKPKSEWDSRSREKPGTESGTGQNSDKERRCRLCKELGHIRQNCPQKLEAPGHSKVSQTSAVEARGHATRPEDLTEDELEKLLAERRLAHEQTLLASADSSHTNTVQASRNCAQAVGSTLMLDISIDGVSVTAMVDTGAQSTIISRSTLHTIGHHYLQMGRQLPTLEKPTVRLYGKDGRKGGWELTVTAQLQLTFSLDGKSVTVPVFVQPDSERACLLGMNVIPLLGISVIRCNGQSILSNDEPEPGTAHVKLIESITIPSQKGQYLKAYIRGDQYTWH